MTDTIENNIRRLDSSGEFVLQLIDQLTHSGPVPQADFIANLTEHANVFREYMEQASLIGSVEVSSKDFWDSLVGQKLAFIDGGVSKVDLIGSSLVGIRAGCYQVELGRALDDEKREDFRPLGCLVDDLYDSRLFDDDFEDVSALSDSSRMLVEVLSAEQLTESSEPPNSIMIHGPLVNPVSPYGTPAFPNFSDTGIQQLASISHGFASSSESDQQHFVSAYQSVLSRLSKNNIPVIGVVERASKRSLTFFEALCEHMLANEIFSKRTYDSLTSIKNESSVWRQFRAFGIGDLMFLSIILAPGEYVLPTSVNRQGPRGKWPQNWASDRIEKVPKPLVSFVRPTADSDPIRVEMFDNLTVGQQCDLCALTLKMSQLLPKYCFPVGLDAVDKFVKVPNWLTKGVESTYGIALLKEAYRSGDIRQMDAAKRLLLANGRDWLFRPKGKL